MYEYTHEKVRKKRMDERQRAIQKLAQDKEPKCMICGGPHAEILHIGHPNHDGEYYRRALMKETDKSWESRTIVKWVLRTPIEEVLKRVQLECPYCNSWHAKFRQYPPEDKRPQWLSTGERKEKRSRHSIAAHLGFVNTFCKKNRLFFPGFGLSG